MVARVSTVSFQGIEAVPVDVQVMIAPGKVNMHIVGLPDKAVAESRERVQAALHASGLSLPAKKVTVNLAPADLPKEGSHFDLPIALGLMAALGAIPADALDGYVVLGELSLDGTIASGRRRAAGGDRRQCAGQRADLPGGECGPEAAWAGEDVDIVAPRSLISLANHFRGTQVLSRPQPAMRASPRQPAGPCGHQGPGNRQAGARGGRGRRPQSDHGRSARGPASRCWRQRLPSILPPLRRPNCWKSR
jgi:magnesium chelatase family protein